MKLLVLDDDEDLRKGLVKGLSAYLPSCEVLEAANGNTGWRLIQQHLPDLVVLDLILPGIGGDAVLRMLKGAKKTAHIKAIIATAKGTEADGARMASFGADGYLMKPFAVKELVHMIGQLLEGGAQA